ncbi:hypothetical protein ACFO1S_11385 [Cohnella boryungensis]|uniref:Uncharacterized protein n=1 Tax=Cohnella boryungensis TaxID=768479 RepID=A0ABV8S9I2_9BACL
MCFSLRHACAYKVMVQMLALTDVLVEQFVLGRYAPANAEAREALNVSGGTMLSC